MGKNYNNINFNRLNENEKIKLKRNIEIYNKHQIVVENQKTRYNKIKNNLNYNHCILILDFKENFKISYVGNELSHDYYNKRHISCLSILLIFKNQN